MSATIMSKPEIGDMAFVRFVLTLLVTVLTYFPIPAVAGTYVYEGGEYPVKLDISGNVIRILFDRKSQSEIEYTRAGFNDCHKISKNQSTYPHPHYDISQAPLLLDLCLRGPSDTGSFPIQSCDQANQIARELEISADRNVCAISSTAAPGFPAPQQQQGRPPQGVCGTTFNRDESSSSNCAPQTGVTMQTYPSAEQRKREEEARKAAAAAEQARRQAQAKEAERQRQPTQRELEADLAKIQQALPIPLNRLPATRSVLDEDDGPPSGGKPPQRRTFREQVYDGLPESMRRQVDVVRNKCIDAPSFNRIVCRQILNVVPVGIGRFIAGSGDANEIDRMLSAFEAGE